jgi:oligopeptidase B
VNKLTTPGVLILMTMITACGDDVPTVPVADKRPVELERHGHVRIDDYFWLNQREDPNVLGYLEAENAYADYQLESSAGLRSRLIDEMKSRIKEDDESAPYRYGEYYYYYRYEPGKEYPIHARKRGSLDADEEILLDINSIAGDEAYFHVDGVRVSPDHRTLAYGVDTRGRRFYNLRFIDLEAGEHLEDEIPDVTPDFEWSSDGSSIVYVRQDPETLRWYQAYHHVLGDNADTLLYEETDETFSIEPYKSVSGQHIFLASDSTTSSEVRFVPADEPSQGFEIFLPREPDHEYSVEDGGDRFLILSNDGAENFQVLETPLDDTSKSAWQVVVRHRDDLLIEYIDVFAGHIAISGVSRGVYRLEILERADNNYLPVSFNEDAFLVYTTNNYDYGRGTVRYMYESMTTPPSAFDLDFETGESALVKRKEIPGGFDPADYQSERLFAEARDGTPVPVSLVYRKGIELDGSNPLLQYGYGSYGLSEEPDFDANLLSLLDRGFVFAIAHIRGGSEMGRQWYYDGRQFEKMNTFTDFIDVSKFLVREGYTSPGHLYARGGSAGGLLMGVVGNMAPELYNGISTRVPFVDVVTTMLDESIPLTTSEWDEWGDPRQKDFYDYMLSYSPYDQVKRQAYPNMLVTAGLHDSQVQYWEPAKWVAKLRGHKTDDKLLLLVTDMQAGHSGKTGRFQRLEDTALYYAFFLELEGISE